MNPADRLAKALSRARKRLRDIMSDGPDCGCTLDGAVHACGWPGLVDDMRAIDDALAAYRDAPVDIERCARALAKADGASVEFNLIYYIDRAAVVLREAGVLREGSE